MRGRQDEQDHERKEDNRVAVAAPWAYRTCRSPGVRQVVEQAAEIRPGLGVHCAPDPLVELGLVQASLAEVLSQAVGDRLAFGVGNPQVLVGVETTQQRREAARPGLV